MKIFSQFISEARTASFNAKRLGLDSDGKGGWYKNGEFVAKTVPTPGPPGSNTLKFYDQQQNPGKDPRQIHAVTPKAQRRVAALKKASDIRDEYIAGNIFNEGDFVRRIVDEKVGKIIRRGTNYLICVTEDDEMFKSWIHDLEEWTDVSGVPADQREVGTPELVRYTMKMTHTKKIQNMINKYKKSTKK